MYSYMYIMYIYIYVIEIQAEFLLQRTIYIIICKNTSRWRRLRARYTCIYLGNLELLLFAHFCQLRIWKSHKCHRSFETGRKSWCPNLSKRLMRYFLTEAENMAAGRIRRIKSDLDTEHPKELATDGCSKLKFSTWADVQMCACLRG